MVVKSKVFRPGEIAEDLDKRVTELEAQVTPNTPPGVLEERKKETTKVLKKIEEVEEICAKEVGKVS